MANTNKVVAGLIQMSMEKDATANVSKALKRIAEAAKKGAQIVCLPELFCSQYFCKDEDRKHFSLAEPIPGPTSEKLSRAARKNKVVILAGLFEKRTEGVYHNTAIVVDATGDLLGKYRKMHVPDDPGFYEKFYFTPGDLGFNSYSTQVAKVGPLICWDQWYPEAARLVALSGAQIIFYPTAIGWHPKDWKEATGMIESWELIQRSHAIANGIYIAAVNRVGHEADFKYWGSSFVVDPFGSVIAKASQSEEILLAECDLGKISETREHWPFLRDRRIDAYEGLKARFLDGG